MSRRIGWMDKAVLFFCAFFLLLPRAVAQSSETFELKTGWQLASEEQAKQDGSVLSQSSFDASKWHAIREMPATVLQVLEDDDVYPNLYYDMNFSTVPQDLWRQDWWYRTTFTAPAGHEVYSIILKGINYRADIWLNGQKIADRSQVVGMYNSFEFDVSKYIHAAAANVLAIRMTPERALLDEDGVELGENWQDWINWKYLGYRDPARDVNISFVPDRNAGVWKRVLLKSMGKVAVRNPYVATDLPLPATTPAALTVYCDLQNNTHEKVDGILRGEITRPGRPSIRFEKNVTLSPSEAVEARFEPSEFPDLAVKNPDLWWPYTWGQPNLYQLKLEFETNGQLSDSNTISFGIRRVTAHRDSDNSFPDIGKGGNFYLQINGRDFLARGAVYTPDLLFKHDPARDRTIVSYVKDLGLNMLRWEAKIADDDVIEIADREGIPVMLGWMCCAQWEHWDEWSAEDQWVARESMRTQIRALRSHPSVVLWADGSDGLPPNAVLNDYHRILQELHWQNAMVDTVSHRNERWDGIHMAGPYVWRPPYYWFSEKFGPARGSSAEEGDNEVVPPLESLQKFIPPDKLWPINEHWFFHAGANDGNNHLENITEAIDRRYGPSSGVAEFARKAQLAHYENVRAQFENYAASGWANHKMMMYWMLNNHWPSFFGHLFDYYFKQGGGYFGAKKALHPLSVVYDYYATGDRTKANIYVVNQTLARQEHLRVSVSFYTIDGARKYFQVQDDVSVEPGSSTIALALARIPGLTSTYFVRCQLRDAEGKLLVENVYWQSTRDDDLGNPHNDEQFTLKQTQWADFSVLNQMAPVEVAISGTRKSSEGTEVAKLTVANASDHVAFFLRVEVTKGRNGREVLPVTYDDNYITVFPHESETINVRFRESDLEGQPPALRLEGWNVRERTAELNTMRGNLSAGTRPRGTSP